MKIEMDIKLLASLIQEGSLTPSQVRCLDEQSKQELRELCVKLCKPSQCVNCDAKKYCMLDGEFSSKLLLSSAVNFADKNTLN